MSGATTGVDQSLIDRVTLLLDQIKEAEQSRPPIEQELQVEAIRLDTLVAKAEAAGQWWPSPSAGFSVAALNDAITAGLLTIEPKKAREAMIERARRKAAAWPGIRLTAVERDKRLNKLRADVRVAQARLEAQRRQVELATGEMQPRASPVDDPSIWLLVPHELDALAASGNGRQR